MKNLFAVLAVALFTIGVQAQDTKPAPKKEKAKKESCCKKLDNAKTDTAKTDTAKTDKKSCCSKK
ncbi:hypothetical protein [Flavobacterium sp. WG21]|jgi:hypothetical protein|uniref:hypothetical protein n=1 Tax=Flavobacterium sp. WG21 TaxID=1229487 RepID=UPI00034868C3|nr:hypothetical protein [Flavobacterium sp. WG21]